jgi:S-sulfosulfanyl-L-cysteine sulfohydrolase
VAVQQQLTIVQINDLHAYLEPHPEVFYGGAGIEYRDAGGVGRIAAVLGQVRAEAPGRVLFGDGGDTFHGTYPAVQTHGQALVPVMNALAPDAMTAHWEFAYTPRGLKDLAGRLDYPVLANNVWAQDGGRPFFDPYTIQETGGLRIGLVGIAANFIGQMMPPPFSEGVTFTSGYDDLPPILDRLRREERVDLVVVLSHLGFPLDMQMAARTAGIDVILSAHTHHRLAQPARVGDTLLIQSGSHGSFLGRLDLTLEAGKIAAYTHRLIAIDAGIAPDPHVAALARQALAPYRDLLDEVVGETAVGLHRGLNMESTWDNLILEALLDHTGAQVAFSNGWRYGAPVPPGPVRLGDLYNALPVDPPVSTVTLTGAELQAMIEENLDHTYARDPYQQKGGYLKRALGLRVYFKIENPPGQRVQQIFVGDQALDPHQRCTAAFITQQGVPQKFGTDRQNHPDKMIDVLRQYLARTRPVRPALRGTFTAV